MLTGRYEGIPGEGLDNTPTMGESMSNSFMASTQAGLQLLPLGKKNRSSISDGVNAMESASQSGDQGWTQWGMNKLASFAGSLVNPLSIAAGSGAGAAVEELIGAVAGLIGRYAAPEVGFATQAVAQRSIGSFLGKNLPEFVGKATIGGLAKGGAVGYATATGFSLPQEIADTYDPHQDSFNWWGGIKASAADGGIGLAIMAVPFLAGTLWGKMFKGENVTHENAPMPLTGKGNPNHPSIGLIDEAVANGKLSTEQAEWYKDMVRGSDTNENLNQRAVDLLLKDGQPIDAATRKVLLQLFSPEDMENLQHAVSDSIASSHIPPNMKDLLVNFMTNGKLDDLSAKSKMVDGLEGVVNFIRKRLSMNPTELSNVRKLIASLKPFKANRVNPITQAKLFEALKRGKNITASIPRQVEKRLRAYQKIKKLKGLVVKYQKEYNKFNNKKALDKINKHQEKIKEVESSLPTLMSHNEEIDYIKSRLIKNGKLIDNFQGSREYQRLQDLSRMSKSSKRVISSAQRLLHEIHVMNEYNLHDHFATMLDSISKLIKGKLGQLAKPQEVMDYLKARIIKEVPDIEKNDLNPPPNPIEMVKDKEKMAKSEYKESLVGYFDEGMKEAPPEIKNSYEATKNKFNEFSESQGIFKKLIDCVMGSLNG